jgi:hypothetical protein
MCCRPDCPNCGTTPAAVAAREKLRAGTQKLLADARALRESGEPLPSLDFLKPVGHDWPHHPIRNPDVEE